MARIERVLLVRSAAQSAVSAHFMPLGLLYLASALRQHRPGIELKLFDCFLGHPEPEDALKAAVGFRPDLIGISSFNVDAAVTHELAAAFKRALPDTPLVVGGPYASTSFRAVLSDENVDAAAIGEGEETIVDLVLTLDRGGELSEVRGLALRAPDGTPTLTLERPYIEDLDSIPFPAWDLVDMSDYDFDYENQYLWVGRRNASIFTSRGCPFRCNYCHHVQGKRFRARSVDNVLAELRILHDRYGVRDVLVQDDVFNFKLSRAKEICDAIIDSGMKFNLSFPNGLRGDIVDDGLVERFAAMNTIFVAYAIESANTERLKKIGRSADIRRVVSAIEKTSAAGIFTHGFFMIGFEDETREEMEATVDLACSLPLNSISLSILNRYEETEPPTTVPKQKQKRWLEIAGSDYQSTKLQRSLVPDDEVQAIRRRGFRRFYSSPRRIARIVNQTPNRPQLLYKGLLAARMALGAGLR
jgi:radical SAM superfamily enzyme YgiQ (UPF0313 family)